MLIKYYYEEVGDSDADEGGDEACQLEGVVQHVFPMRVVPVRSKPMAATSVG